MVEAITTIPLQVSVRGNPWESEYSIQQRFDLAIEGTVVDCVCLGEDGLGDRLAIDLINKRPILTASDKIGENSVTMWMGSFFFISQPRGAAVEVPIGMAYFKTLRVESRRRGLLLVQVFATPGVIGVGA